ncbi:MBL fold metallo-hydrolase [Kosmotoga pacifica]|uniref:Metallo-beta-lactamase domain-containing protein 1 n=1 Tax=Kosmotoga pacifica TaxID=1330330 RepID=A0A0G2Z8H1_9BACT|nr:MBL fold metallo-hydrolase [Kosmotoga pacifica]AKI97867.1 beta-lactamase [Kosmotoga pacifica]
MEFELLFSGSVIYVSGVIDAPTSSAVLLKDSERVVVIDPGGFPSLKALESSLSKVGVAPEEVTDVLLTHFHLDHAFNSIFFKNATIRLHKNYATRNYRAFGPVIGQMYSMVLDSWKRIEPFESGMLWDTVEIIETPFHSREHVSFLARTRNAGNVLIFGDLCDRQFRFYEMRKGMRTDEAAKIALELYDRADTIVFSHDLPIIKG